MSASTVCELVEADYDPPVQLAVPVGSEIDSQIATAKRYPRDLKRFRENAIAMVSSDKQLAAECSYSVPRGGKKVSGESIRFAEVVQSCYGNCRVASRIIDIDSRFVTAQGAFMDLENNVAITFDVKRQITDKDGNLYSESTIQTTCVAAGAIAMRSATLRGIPEPLWKPIYEAAQKAARCSDAELPAARERCVEYFQSKGVELPAILASVGAATIADIDAGKLDTLRGFANSIREGMATVDEIFSATTTPASSKAKRSTLNDDWPSPAELAADEERLMREGTK